MAGLPIASHTWASESLKCLAPLVLWKQLCAQSTQMYLITDPLTIFFSVGLVYLHTHTHTQPFLPPSSVPSSPSSPKEDTHSPKMPPHDLVPLINYHL